MGAEAGSVPVLEGEESTVCFSIVNSENADSAYVAPITLALTKTTSLQYCIHPVKVTPQMEQRKNSHPHTLVVYATYLLALLLLRYLY